MPFIGNKPAQVPLTSADITDGIITSAKIVDGTIANADINSSAAIAKTKLNLTGTIGISDLSATGTASSTTFLRGDNTWGSAGATAGQVIQVVSATDSTQRSTSSGSFVTASNTLSVTITPSSSANKIYLICTTQFYAPTGYFTIYRNGSTNLGNATYGLGMATDGDLGVRAPGAIGYYDSPATTSATTYQVYLKGNPGAGQSGTINYNNVPGTIMAFEVKG
jgi:hypothetical protein